MSRLKLLTSLFIFYAILQYAETCNQNNKAKCDELMQKNHLQVGSYVLIQLCVGVNLGTKNTQYKKRCGGSQSGTKTLCLLRAEIRF